MTGNKKIMGYAGFAIIILFVLIALSQREREDRVPRGDPSSYQALELKWKAEFAHSPDTAYADFLQQAKALSYDDAHTLSHVIGEVIYREFGDAGIARCTDDFGFGCYHGFAGTALNAHGLAGVNRLSAACNASGDLTVAFACVHGIGHGILSYLGNDKLTEALQTCAPINGPYAIGGCYGGVFMEYNYNTMQSPEGIELRPYSTSTAYEPCATEIPEQFRKACYYDLPSWWIASFGGSGIKTQNSYARAGKLCTAISDPVLRTTCYQGIGVVIALSGNAATMKQNCVAVRIPDAVDPCYHEALQYLLQSDSGRSELRALCVSGSISYENTCGSVNDE